MSTRTPYFQITAEPGKFSKRSVYTHTGKGRVHKMACCDCGLVHDMQFEAWSVVRKNGRVIGYRRIPRRFAVVMMRARRNVKATAARRKNKKFKGLRLTKTHPTTGEGE